MKSQPLRLIIALVACAASLVGYGLWYATLSAKSAAVAELQLTIDTKTETVNRIAATRATLSEIASDEAIVRNYFVPETGVVAFIDALEERGRVRGAALNVLSVSTGGTAPRPALLLTLSILGTFDAVMRTVGSIEYAPYALSISALSLTRESKDAWRADFKLLVGSVSATRPATSTQTVSSTALVPPAPYAYF